SAVGAFGAFLLALANRRLSLQTSFLTPPFGFALFYLRGVTPASVPTSAIYRGVVPFIGLQLGMLLALALFPGLATWLPSLL
ncbi:TRAP transporter large permease subunit, partial [Halomonas sp.]|uniref:TRAP transporter large permease subunit n=1 Tax=Halomonas sp. TaxID=1486246 RepID=UPI0035683EB3